MTRRTLTLLLGGAAAAQTLSQRRRRLLAFAPSAADGSLQRQRALFEAAGAGALERDLVFEPVVGNGADAAALRDRFGVSGQAFVAVLVGRDGGAKLRSREPITAETLFAAIDAMPMRRQELRR